MWGQYEFRRLTIDLEGGGELKARSIRIPGDISSAAFLVAATLALPDSELCLKEVGVNPTRSGYLSLLERVGESFRLDC